MVSLISVAELPGIRRDLIVSLILVTFEPEILIQLRPKVPVTLSPCAMEVGVLPIIILPVARGGNE
jgi:hypothetical protein